MKVLPKTGYINRKLSKNETQGTGDSEPAPAPRHPNRVQTGNRVNFSYIHASGDQDYNSQKIEGKNKISKCHFKSSRFLTEDIIQIRSVPRRVPTNHPLLIGCTVLDLSKVKMLEIYYKHIFPKFGSNQKIVYHDTDSFIISLEGEGVLKK